MQKQNFMTKISENTKWIVNSDQGSPYDAEVLFLWTVNNKDYDYAVNILILPDATVFGSNTCSTNSPFCSALHSFTE